MRVSSNKLPRIDRLLRCAGIALLFLGLTAAFTPIDKAEASCPWYNPTCGGNVVETICSSNCVCQPWIPWDDRPSCFVQFIVCDDGTPQILSRCVGIICFCTRIEVVSNDDGRSDR